MCRSSQGSNSRGGQGFNLPVLQSSLWWSSHAAPETPSWLHACLYAEPSSPVFIIRTLTWYICMRISSLVGWSTFQSAANNLGQVHVCMYTHRCRTWRSTLWIQSAAIGILVRPGISCCPCSPCRGPRTLHSCPLEVRSYRCNLQSEFVTKNVHRIWTERIIVYVRIKQDSQRSIYQGTVTI